MGAETRHRVPLDHIARTIVEQLNTVETRLDLLRIAVKAHGIICYRGITGFIKPNTMGSCRDFVPLDGNAARIVAAFGNSVGLTRFLQCLLEATARYANAFVFHPAEKRVGALHRDGIVAHHNVLIGNGLFVLTGNLRLHLTLFDGRGGQVGACLADRFYHDTTRSALDCIALDQAIRIAARLNCRALAVGERVVENFHIGGVAIQECRMAPHSTRNIVERAVLNGYILCGKHLGSILLHMRIHENV